MANKFEFVGKLSMGKSSDKFTPFEVRTSDKGWTNTDLFFNVIAGDNRHNLEVKGFHKADGTGAVYTQTKNSINPETKETIKGEPIKVEWKDRKKPEILSDVAEFKKFVLDLEEPNRRYKLEKALEKVKEGSITQEELDELEVVDVEKELEESKKKRVEYISEVDYAETLNKLITSGKYKDRLFKISGEIRYEVSTDGTKFYKKLIPTRIYLADKTAQPESIGHITLFYKKDACEEFGDKVIIKGFVRNYDKQRKADISAPVIIEIHNGSTDEKKLKLNTLLQNQFTVKDKTYKELGVKVIMLNGSQKMEITEDMLTDLQKELLSLEAITLDEIRKELGGDIYGKPVDAMVVENIGKKYTKGRKDTVFTDANFVVKALEIKEKVVEKTEDEVVDFSSFIDGNIEDDDLPF